MGMKRLSVVVSAIVALCVFVGQGYAQDAAAPAGDVTAAAKVAPGSYKIGIVSRKDVFDKYNKTKTEYARLETEVKDLQKGIDDLSTKIEAAKKEYEAKKDSMSESERNDLEGKIKLDFQRYKSEFKAHQELVDGKEMTIVKKLFEEIDAAISKIGAEGGYHLVLDGSPAAAPSGINSVLYFSTTLDITQKVVDLLNSQAPAASSSPEAAPAPAASDTQEKKADDGKKKHKK
jgi:Skp family chaperone for outer membrane proteins